MQIIVGLVHNHQIFCMVFIFTVALWMDVEDQAIPEEKYFQYLHVENGGLMSKLGSLAGITFLLS